MISQSNYINMVPYYNSQKIFKCIRQVVFFTLLFLCFSFSLKAQSNNGKLTGKITDSATNQTLVGVSVTPKGSNKGTATITGGTYILSLPAGSYTIRYSYTGYAEKDISELEIKSGETTFMNILLAPKSNTLAGVVISIPAKKESQSAVYNKQRLSSAASDGISQEQISKTPDNNAGQILKRVTGVSVQNEKFVVVRGLGAQYNQTVLNGVAMTSTETNQNAFSFDLIPSAAIDNITVNKTATPDLPGNFAGGIVQVNTKDFPAKDFFSVALQTGFSDGTFGKDFLSDKRGNLEWLSFAAKSRDLPSSFPQSGDRVQLFQVNPQERIRYLKLLPNNLAPLNNGASGHDLSDLNESLQLGFGKTIRLKERNQFGIVAALTQRKTELIQNESGLRDAQIAGLGAGGNTRGAYDYFSVNTRYSYSSELAAVLNVAYNFGNNKITLKNLFSHVLRNSYIKRDSVVDYETGFPKIGPQGIQGFSYFFEQRGLLNSILSGEHKIGKNKETQLDWNINVTSNSTEFPDTRNFLLSSDDNGNLVSNTSGTNLPTYLLTSSRLWSNVKDIITGGAFNLSSVINIFKAKQVIKGGLLFQNRRRIATATVLPYEAINAPLDSVLAPAKYAVNGLDVNPGAQSYLTGSGNYNAATSLQAAYESLENKFGKYLRVIWGIRFENYQQSISVYNQLFNRNFQSPELVPVKFSSQTTFNFLPSINVIYSPVKSVNIRGAFSTTVIRPDLKDLAGFTRFDFETFQLSTGNENLKSTVIRNYDFKAEWFPSSGEIISFGAFYKKLTDPIEYGQVTSANVFLGKLAINSGDANIKGIEAEFRKKLNFIAFAPWLKNVTFFGNGSLLNSKVEGRIIYNNYFNFSPEHRLTGQPKYIVNGGLSISAFKNSFEATLSYNRTGDYIDRLGGSELSRDNVFSAPVLLVPNYILQARDILDVSLRQAVIKGKGQIKINISNLLAKPLVIYQDNNGNNKLDNPVKVNLLVNQSTFLDQATILSGIDNIAYFIQGQRSFSITFSYTF